MPRSEFSRETRRLALLRSKGFCEAAGLVYGLAEGQRCNAPLSYGVEFDHYPIRAADGGDASLGNCAAVCLNCHRWKTRHFDIPMVAKQRRIIAKRTNTWRRRDGFRTNRNGPYKRRLDGSIVPR